MKKLIQNKLKNQKGLTLIELLAVIVILAIIAAIAIPAIGNIIENSRVGAAKSDGLNVLAAADLYLIDNPDAFTEAGQDGITSAELTGGGYLEDLGGFGNTGGSLTSVTQVGTTDVLGVTATAVIGGVTVAYNVSPKDAIIGLANSAGGTPAVTFGTITVTR